ncbi:MAG: hypothetical protein EOO63_08585 [Hymenobacter sp.]|nr:MAG: hypothetical protein EOO63_08585 [Hymenobacter sp.]
MAVSENAELEELIRQATSGAEAVPPAGGGLPAQSEEEGGDSLDLNILAMVARRSLPWVVLLLLLGFTGSWLYLRYTKPIYKAQSMLKLDERNYNSVLGGGGAAADGSSGQLAGEVELIKSGVTYKYIKQRVPLRVNYYTKGTVLETELFGNSPFRVEDTLTDPVYYNHKFDVELVDAQHYQLTIVLGQQSLGGTYAFGQAVQLPGISLKLLRNAGQSLEKDGVYHFTLLDDGSIDSYLNRNLTVEVVNFNANTIQIGFTDNNRAKAARIVNALDSVYLQVKLERKRESTAQVQAYLTKQLGEANAKLNSAEDALMNWVSLHSTYDPQGELASTVGKQQALAAQRLELEQSMRVLDEVGTLADQQRLTMSEDQTVAQNLPELTDLRDPVLVQLLEQLNRQQIDLAKVRRSYRDVTEAVAARQAEMTTAQQAVRKQLGQARKTLQTKLTFIGQQNGELEAKLGALPAQATELARLNRPLQLYQSNVQSLLQQQSAYSGYHG